jgi:4-hydroxy-3-polyprenylbenzoate decarboxylase
LAISGRYSSPKIAKHFCLTMLQTPAAKPIDIPVVVGALAANPEIYAAGLGVPVEEIGDVWNRAMDNPIQPVAVDDAPCQEVVMTGDDLTRPGGGPRITSGSSFNARI